MGEDRLALQQAVEGDVGIVRVSDTRHSERVTMSHRPLTGSRLILGSTCVKRQRDLKRARFTSTVAIEEIQLNPNFS